MSREELGYRLRKVADHNRLFKNSPSIWISARLKRIWRRRAELITTMGKLESPIFLNNSAL